MRDSLRVRLVLWYALVLALVVVSYGGAVVYQSWRSTMAGVDAELEMYAREIRNALKPVEGGRFEDLVGRKRAGERRRERTILRPSTLSSSNSRLLRSSFQTSPSFEPSSKKRDAYVVV